MHHPGAGHQTGLDFGKKWNHKMLRGRATKVFNDTLLQDIRHFCFLVKSYKLPTQSAQYHQKFQNYQLTRDISSVGKEEKKIAVNCEH